MHKKWHSIFLVQCTWRAYVVRKDGTFNTFWVQTCKRRPVKNLGHNFWLYCHYITWFCQCLRHYCTYWSVGWGSALLALHTRHTCLWTVICRHQPTFWRLNARSTSILLFCLKNKCFIVFKLSWYDRIYCNSLNFQSVVNSVEHYCISLSGVCLVSSYTWRALHYITLRDCSTLTHYNALHLESCQFQCLKMIWK